MTNDITGWATSAELVFIDSMAVKTEGVGLLRGYLIGMTRRRDFGRIDANECVAHAQKRLAERDRQAKILHDITEFEALK